MANYISTLGSTCKALILCTTDTIINGQSYKANQPVIYLTDVQASIDSQVVTPQASNLSPTNKGLHLLDGTEYLDQLIINNVPYSKKVQNLFFYPATTVLENYDWMRVNAEEVKLRAQPIDIYVYKNGELIEDYNVDGDWLMIQDYDEMANYVAGYSYVDNNLKQFTNPHYPYFKVVLYTKGNSNNKTVDQIFIFNKVALIPQTALQFMPNTQNFVTLNFGIIDADKTVRMKIDE